MKRTMSNQSKPFTSPYLKQSMVKHKKSGYPLKKVAYQNHEISNCEYYDDSNLMVQFIKKRISKIEISVKLEQEQRKKDIQKIYQLMQRSDNTPHQFFSLTSFKSLDKSKTSFSLSNENIRKKKNKQNQKETQKSCLYFKAFQILKENIQYNQDKVNQKIERIQKILENNSFKQQEEKKCIRFVQEYLQKEQVKNDEKILQKIKQFQNVSLKKVNQKLADQNHQFDKKIKSIEQCFISKENFEVLQTKIDQNNERQIQKQQQLKNIESSFQKQILFVKNFMKVLEQKIYFSFQTNNDLKSEIQFLKDEFECEILQNQEKTVQIFKQNELLQLINENNSFFEQQIIEFQQAIKETFQILNLILIKIKTYPM